MHARQAPASPTPKPPPPLHAARRFNCNHFIVSQCNPHIVPLLNFMKTLSRKWANLFELELRHKCTQAQWLLSDVMPTKWLTLFTQPWEGDITIVLPRWGAVWRCVVSAGRGGM